LQQTCAEWHKIFGIIAGTYAGGVIIYTLFGTEELQLWNSVQKETDSDKNELETEKIPLRNNNVRKPSK